MHCIKSCRIRFFLKSSLTLILLTFSDYPFLYCWVADMANKFKRGTFSICSILFSGSKFGKWRLFIVDV